MNKFILLKARNDELYRRAKFNLGQRALGLIQYNPDLIRVREFRNSNVIFASFELSNTGGFRKHYTSTSPDGTLAFDGMPYARNIIPAKNWARQLQDLWSDDDEQLIEGLHGTWALAKFDEAAGARILSDFSGMTPLFYWHDRDYLAVSPRQMMLAGICGSLEQDVESMAWLSGQANLIGDQTPWKNVRHIPPQWTMTFSPVRGDLAFSLEQREIWSESIDPQPDDAQVRGIADSMLEQCAALSQLPLPPLHVDITGGLDSRLVAALVMGSPLSQNVEYLQTSGPEDSHEIQVGRAIAASLGLQHVARTPGASRATSQRIINSIRSSVFRYEASICPSDGFIPSTSKSRVVLTGSAGEIYRRHCKPHMKVVLRSEAELKTLFADYHQKTDPLGIEMDRVSRSQRESLQELAQGFHHAGVDLNDVSDIFFMRYRLPLWNGIMMNNIFAATRIYPLVNYHAAKYAFSRGFLARIRDRIHFEIMMQVNPGLCSMPFLKSVWPEDFRKMALDQGVRVADSPYPVKGKNSMAQRNMSMSVLAKEGWGEAASYILDSRNSRLWDVVDYGKVERVMHSHSGESLKVPEMKQIFSLIGMQAALCGDSIRKPDGDLSKPPHLDGVVATELFGGSAVKVSG